MHYTCTHFGQLIEIRQAPLFHIAGPTEIVVPPLPVPVQSTPPVVPPAVAAAAAAPAAAGPEDAAAASSKQASTTAPACTSGDKRKTPKSDTVESLREDSFDPCNWSPIEDSDTGEDPHHAAKPETTAQIEKDPDKVTMIHGRSDQSGPNGPAGRPNPYVDKTPVFRSSMESGTLARRDGKFSMSPQSIKRVSREGASVDGSSPKSGRASGEVDLSPVPAVHRSSREPRRDARPPCLTGLQRSAPRPSREAVSPNSLSDRSRNKDQDISPSHRKLSPSSGTGSYNLHATSPGGRERSGSGGRSSSRRSYRDSNIPKRSPTDPSSSDRYHTPQGKPELRGVSESEVRTPQTKYSKQPNVDSCDICTAQPVDTSHKPEGQSQRQLYHDWDSNSQEVSRREFRGRRDFITPSEETPVNISVEQSVADIHHPPADVRVYPASPQYPENDRPPGKYVTKQFTTVDNKSQFLLSTPTQKPCHRRSLPAITTDMYKHMDSKKATATGCSPRNRTLLLLHERRSRSFDSYVDDKHTDHEQYPEQVNDRENINVDQSVNTPATKPGDYPSQHVVEGRDLKTDSVDINKTPADPTMSVPPTLYKKADYRDEKVRLRHKDTPDYRQTKKYEPSSPDYSGKHSLPIKDTSPRRQLPSPRKGISPSRYPEDNARPRTHPADMPERDAQGSYKYRSASDTRHSAENREKTLISDYYRLRHSDNDSFYKSSMSSMQASTDGVKERRKRLLQQKKSQSLDAMCDPSEGDEAAQKLSAPEKTGREVSPSRQTDSGTRYLPRRVSKRNLLKVMHEGRSRSFDSPYEDECPVDHEWTPPPHHPHHSDSPPRDYTHKTHTTGENWDREKNKHIKNHPQENISERERERDYEYSQVMASKDGRRPRPCHAFSMPQEVEPVYSLRVAKDLAEEKRRQSYTPGVSSNEYRHRGHSPHDCEMRRVRQAAAANSENQRHTQPFDREHGWSEESCLPRESEHRKKSAECESHALKHPSLPLDKPRRRSRQITEDDARPRQVSCQDDLQSQHFKRDSIRSSRSPDPTGAMSASTRSHKERPEGVTGHKIETAKSRRLHNFHHQKSHSVDVPEKASEVESQRLADSKPLQRSYPIDEKSNGLSGIRKKSIGDLMNEIAQLKPQKSGDVRGSAERATLLSVFSDMRDTDDGVERKKSKKRARFQQQKSYSLDIPSRSGRPPSEKKESTLPKPARVEAPVSSGTIISESRDKSPNTTRVKRTVQFQTQKSYSLDVLVTEDEEENKTSMSCNVETSYRKRVASDTSDGPNCSGNGEYKSSGSNRQKLIQMRAMKLKAENEDNSTSSDKKTKGASPNPDQGKQRVHGGSERSSSQVRREADMLRPELESQTRSGTSPPRHSERKRSPGRDKEGTGTSRDRESHSQRRRDRERDSEKRRDQKSVSKYRDVQEIPKREVRKREGHSPGREVDYYMSQREPSDHPEPREWERYHHQSPVQGQTRRASCSPSRDAEGRNVHQQSFSPSRDESRQSPGRGRKRSPSSRETTHTSTAGGSPLGSPGTQGGDWRNLTKADLIKAIQERLDSNPLRGQYILSSFRPLGHERVYLPLYKVADTPYYIQGDDLL